ncbi:MAG: CGNR zinc finger domain-containing protein [Candidatus Eremiobacteraeota bacterium]|nr:CGNR zinc finger domain-containing protein [Candidatus Eremiobacteraeota bacterium]
MAVSFANTACPEAGSTLSESYRDMLATLGTIGCINAVAGRRLTKFEGVKKAAEAVALVQRFRKTVIKGLDAMVAGRAIPVHVVSELNRALAACGCRREVDSAGGAYALRVVYEIAEPADVLMPLANSFAELLSSADFTRVKRCRDERCTCYFVDTSKNRTRAWCSMERCGNRQKVATYYRRLREASG